VIILMAVGAVGGAYLTQSGILTTQQEKIGKAMNNARALIPGGAHPSQSIPPLEEKKPDDGLPPDSIRQPKQGFNEGFLKTARLQSAVAGESISIPGKLALNAKRVHIISGRLDGRVEKIHTFEGEKVQAGQAVAEIFSPDYISAQHEFLLADSTEKTFRDAGLKDLMADAEATEQSARNRLLVLGATAKEIEKMEVAGVAERNLILRAPITGVVIKRNLDPGAFLKTGDPLMSVANMEELWFYGNVYEKDYAKIRLGETVRMTSKALPGKEFKGVVSFISTAIDPVTHTLPIRCDVPNPHGDLRPELFVTGEIEIHRTHVLLAPKEAVVEIADLTYVIIQKEPGLFQRIPVTTLPYDSNHLAIASGLKPDQEVLVDGVILINQMIDNQKQ
jgi:Cu(I)/Ag(I) efflux system membrane fusion protein